MKNFFTYLFVLIALVQSAQDKYVDSLKNVLRDCKEDSCRCIALSLLAENAVDGEWENFNESLKILTERKLKSADYKDSPFYKKYYATAINNCGLIADNTGNVPQALKYYDEALKIREQLNEKEGAAVVMNNIACIYQLQGDIEKTLLYFNKSLDTYKEMGNRKGMSPLLNNIGLVYMNKGKFDKALPCFEQALSLEKEFNYEDAMGATLGNIGMIYDYTKKFELAEKYYKESIEHCEKIGALDGLAISIHNLGNLYFHQGKTAEALALAKKSMKIASEIGYPETIAKAAGLLSDIYEKTGHSTEALEMFTLMVSMNDSIINESNKQESMRSHLKYEFERKAAADSIRLADEKKVQQTKLDEEQNLRMGLTGGLALTVVFGLMMYQRFRVTRKQKKLIEAQKQTLEEQKLLVEEKQREITDSIIYARRIQQSLMPSERYFQQGLNRQMR